MTIGRPLPKFLGSVKLSGFQVMTPGSSSDSWEKLRPLSGRLWMVPSEMTSPTTASWVCRIGVTPTTSTLSETPSCIWMSTRAFWPVSRRIGFVS